MIVMILSISVIGPYCSTQGELAVGLGGTVLQLLLRNLESGLIDPGTMMALRLANSALPCKPILNDS